MSDPTEPGAHRTGVLLVTGSRDWVPPDLDGIESL